MPNKHIIVAYSWVSLSLWIAFPSFMTILATIAAAIIAVSVTALTYRPVKLPPIPTRQVTQ